MRRTDFLQPFEVINTPTNLLDPVIRKLWKSLLDERDAISETLILDRCHLGRDRERGSTLEQRSTELFTGGPDGLGQPALEKEPHVSAAQTFEHLQRIQPEKCRRISTIM